MTVTPRPRDGDNWGLAAFSRAHGCEDVDPEPIKGAGPPRIPADPPGDASALTRVNRLAG